jgi:hypothetical protein
MMLQLVSHIQRRDWNTGRFITASDLGEAVYRLGGMKRLFGGERNTCTWSVTITSGSESWLRHILLQLSDERSDIIRLSKTLTQQTKILQEETGVLLEIAYENSHWTCSFVTYKLKISDGIRLSESLPPPPPPPNVGFLGPLFGLTQYAFSM